MLYFLKGTTLLYAGQEFENDHLPSLFEKEPIDRQTGKDLTPLLKALASIKRALGVPGYFRAEADDANDIAVMQRAGDTGHFVGVFSLKGKQRRSPAFRPWMARMKTCWAEPPSPSQPGSSPARASL